MQPGASQARRSSATAPSTVTKRGCSHAPGQFHSCCTCQAACMAAWRPLHSLRTLHACMLWCTHACTHAQPPWRGPPWSRCRPPNDVVQLHALVGGGADLGGVVGRHGHQLVGGNDAALEPVELLVLLACGRKGARATSGRAGSGVRAPAPHARAQGGDMLRPRSHGGWAAFSKRVCRVHRRPARPCAAHMGRVWLLARPAATPTRCCS